MNDRCGVLLELALVSFPVAQQLVQGDAIALVVAETPEILEQAKKLVKVDYEVLPAVHNPKEAAAEGAPLVHEKGNLLAYKGVQSSAAPRPWGSMRYCSALGAVIPCTAGLSG